MINCILSVTLYCAISIGLILTCIYVRKPCSEKFAHEENKDFLKTPISLRKPCRGKLADEENEDFLKIQICLILFFAALYTLYNAYCTFGKDISKKGEGDRFVYYLQFIGEGKSTVGLTFVFDIIRLFTDNFNAVLYFTTFTCCCMFFIALSQSKDVTVYSVVFLLITDIIVGVTFVNLKQSFAIGFAYLMFVICFNKEKTLINEIMAWGLIVAAILFHITAVILIPIYFLIRFTGWQKKYLYVFVVILALCMAFMQSLGPLVAKILININPSSALAAKLNEYFTNGGITSGGSAFAFIKGFPFYLISAIGIAKRNRLRTVIDNYDSYLLLSIIGSLFYLCSAQTYWIYRMIYYFYLPISIFIGQIIKKGLDTTFDKCAVGLCYLSEAVVFFRWFILIYINYGGF